MSFAKSNGKDLGNEYSQNLFNAAKKSTTDAIKTASKRAIEKPAETTSDLIDNNIADKTTNLSKKSSKELHSQNEIEIPKERYISPEKRQ